MTFRENILGKIFLQELWLPSTVERVKRRVNSCKIMRATLRRSTSSWKLCGGFSNASCRYHGCVIYAHCICCVPIKRRRQIGLRFNVQLILYIITENIDKVNSKWPRLRCYDTYQISTLNLHFFSSFTLSEIWGLETIDILARTSTAADGDTRSTWLWRLRFI